MGGGTAADCRVVTPVNKVGNGGFLICDYNNNRVRSVDDRGLMSTVVGTGELGFSGDGNLPVWSTGNRFSSIDAGAAGNFLVIDRSDRRVRVIEST